MDSALSQANRSWGVRGNIFSFLLPWEEVLTQLFEKVEDGDLSQWPLAPDVVLHGVGVRFVRGPEDLLQKFRDLYVRSKVVKKLAAIYIDRKVNDLATRPGVLEKSFSSEVCFCEGIIECTRFSASGCFVSLAVCTFTWP